MYIIGVSTWYILINTVELVLIQHHVEETVFLLTGMITIVPIKPHNNVYSNYPHNSCSVYPPL